MFAVYIYNSSIVNISSNNNNNIVMCRTIVDPAAPTSSKRTRATGNSGRPSSSKT